MQVDRCFAIITPTYNRGRRITNMLNSVVEQSYRPIHIYIVDNNSTDNTTNIVEEFIEANSSDNLKFTLLSQPQKGACAARNIGLEVCSEEFVMFFDDDDTLSPNCVEEVMNKFLQEGCDVVGFKSQYAFENGRTKPKKNPFNPTIVDHVNHCTLATNTYAAKRKIFTNVNGWDNDIMRWQDWVIGVKILSKHPKIAWIKDKALATLNTHNNSITGNGYLHSARDIDNAIHRAYSYIRNNYSGSDKDYILRIIYSRFIIMAAHYKREGGIEEADEYLSAFIWQYSSPIHKFVAKVIYIYTQLGFRGGADILKFILK